MYVNEMTAKQATCGQLVGGTDYNPTVGENLEWRIKQLETELERLKASRDTLQPLLGMRIRDIRDAMNY